MINCKTCRNTKNCVYAGADREMEECVDRIPTTHSDIIRSMTDEDLATFLGITKAWYCYYADRSKEFAKQFLVWLREEVDDGN